MKKSLYARYGKRMLDFAISSCALIVASPVMLGTYMLVKKKLGTPVFFCQERPGLHGTDGEKDKS